MKPTSELFTSMFLFTQKLMRISLTTNVFAQAIEKHTPEMRPVLQVKGTHFFFYKNANCQSKQNNCTNLCERLSPGLVKPATFELC